MQAKPIVLVVIKLGEGSLQLLRSEANMDYSYNLLQEELYTKISLYDSLNMRSGTKVTHEVFESSDKRIKVIKRASRRACETIVIVEMIQKEKIV